MATTDGAGAPAGEVAAEVPQAVATILPKVESEVIADEEKFDCPQPWFLALLTVAMSAMTSITVAGSLFFVLAAPEKVSPRCYEHPEYYKRMLCTLSSVAFWTYPVVCCLFVVLLFAKNLVDQRTYYEFLLHKVIIGYGRNPPHKQPTVLLLLLYAVAAFSALVWYAAAQTGVMVGHVYASLAYITPIISFLAVIFAQWSIQGKLITLPNFLEDYDWAVAHLNQCRCYPVEVCHTAYLMLENDLDNSDETVDTARMIALVEEYSKKVQSAATPRVEDVEEGGEATKVEKPLKHGHMEISEAEKQLMASFEETKEYVYWEVRMLFNPRLQDDRSHSFRNWALAYMVTVVFAILLSVYIFSCCLITCLEIERVLTPDMVSWGYTHYFSLRPDLGGVAEPKSLKQLAASVSMSAMQTGARSFYKAAQSHFEFHIGAAA